MSNEYQKKLKDYIRFFLYIFGMERKIIQNKIKVYQLFNAVDCHVDKKETIDFVDQAENVKVFKVI